MEMQRTPLSGKHNAWCSASFDGLVATRWRRLPRGQAPHCRRCRPCQETRMWLPLPPTAITFVRALLWTNRKYRAHQTREHGRGGYAGRRAKGRNRRRLEDSCSGTANCVRKYYRAISTLRQAILAFHGWRRA